MADYTVVASDVPGPLRAVLKYADGTLAENIDLADAITFRMTPLPPTSGAVVTGTCSVVDPDDATVQYAWAVGDLDAGLWGVRFAVDGPGTYYQTFPADTLTPYVTIQVLE